MIVKKILIFGATGQIGRYCIRRLVKNNYKVIAATRNSHKAIFLKTQAPIGYLEIEEVNIFDETRLNNLISRVDICINLIGILFEKDKRNTFDKIHSDFPERLSKICKNNNVDFIHISALALNKAKDSKYAQSKIKGENKIRENFLKATIIKPSIVHSVDDNFSTRLLTLLKLLPIFIFRLASVFIQNGDYLLTLDKICAEQGTISDDGEQEWQSMLADDSANPEEVVTDMKDAQARSAWLDSALGGLDDREQTIIRQRHLDDETVTLEALGEQLGISKERVRQIEKRAMEKMRGTIEDVSEGQYESLL